jgi:hypothetical protein
MGSKRVGLARMEALMESLKREIVGFNVEITANSATTVTATADLARNSVNLINEQDAATFTLPAASSCSRGDVIIVKYIGLIDNSTKHAYTSADFFASHSCLFGKAAETGDSQDVKTFITAPNGTSNDFLNITGATNGTGGIGTILRFHFDGSQWAVNGQLEKRGDGSAAATAAFADS